MSPSATLGALFLGGIIAVLFSGVVISQAFSYFRRYPNDAPMIKTLAVFVLGFDFLHSVWVTIALWDHLIAHFGDGEYVDYIPWSLALTIVFTAILTFAVHIFFVYRIYRLSLESLLLCIPMALMACARLCFACLTTAKMIEYRSLQRFVQFYKFSFTTGLALSSALDVFITASMVFLLSRNQKSNSSMNHVLDKLMLYTFENGSLTCAATLASLICWLVNNKHLAFMGLHFVISKFYANSLYATLNARRGIQKHRRFRSTSGERSQPIMFSDSRHSPKKAFFSLSSKPEAEIQQLESIHVKVDRAVVSDDRLMDMRLESRDRQDII